MTCHDIFNTARTERAKCPLTEGRYKLEEALRAIERWQDFVTTVAARVRTGGKFGKAENLGPCMADERGPYLKGIPAQLARLIGYDILPAIAALEGDGVPKAEVQRLLSRAETDVQRLIDAREAVRLCPKGGISREYDAMCRGESELLAVLDTVDQVCKFWRVAVTVFPSSAQTQPWKKVINGLQVQH
jgi:hypothetical protein